MCTDLVFFQVWLIFTFLNNIQMKHSGEHKDKESTVIGSKGLFDHKWIIKQVYLLHVIYIKGKSLRLLYHSCDAANAVRYRISKFFARG